MRSFYLLWQLLNLHFPWMKKHTVESFRICSLYLFSRETHSSLDNLLLLCANPSDKGAFCWPCAHTVTQSCLLLPFLWHRGMHLPLMHSLCKQVRRALWEIKPKVEFGLWFFSHAYNMQLFHFLFILMAMWRVSIGRILSLVTLGLEIQFGWKEEQM